MLSRYAFTALWVAVIATQGFAFPQDDKKNDLENVISETNEVDPGEVVKAGEAGEGGEANGVTAPPAPTTLTVGVTEPAPSSTSSAPAEDPKPSTSDPASTSTTTPKPSAGNSLTRLIDDIFQIPISVLKAVNTLLSNPFRSRTGSHE